MIGIAQLITQIVLAIIPWIISIIKRKNSSKYALKHSIDTVLAVRGTDSPLIETSDSEMKPLVAKGTTSGLSELE